MWSRINKKRIENVLCRFGNYIGGIRKQLCDFEMTCWALCGVETTQVKLKLLYCGVKVESRFACFYLTRQLEWKLREFQLAEVVLVVSKPHVFNLTGQLVSTPPECSTLAATDQCGTKGAVCACFKGSATHSRAEGRLILSWGWWSSSEILFVSSCFIFCYES
jgi:hypothetical protein